MYRYLRLVITGHIIISTLISILIIYNVNTFVKDNSSDSYKIFENVYAGYNPFMAQKINELTSSNIDTLFIPKINDKIVPAYRARDATRLNLLPGSLAFIEYDNRKLPNSLKKFSSQNIFNWNDKRSLYPFNNIVFYFYKHDSNSYIIFNKTEKTKKNDNELLHTEHIYIVSKTILN